MAANLGGIGVTVVIQLVSVPVLLGAWGIGIYGEWLVLSAIPTYLALSDLSFSTVAGNSMVMLEAQGRHAELVALGRRLWSIVTVLTIAALVAAIAIAMFFGGAFGRDSAIPTPEARIILLALFLQVAVGIQWGVLDAWYRAGGRYPLSTVLRNIGRLLEFGGLMVAVLAGGSPGIAAIAFLLGSSAGFVLALLVLRQVVPWSTFRLGRPHLQTFRGAPSPWRCLHGISDGQCSVTSGFHDRDRGHSGGRRRCGILDDSHDYADRAVDDGVDQQLDFSRARSVSGSRGPCGSSRHPASVRTAVPGCLGIPDSGPWFVRNTAHPLVDSRPRRRPARSAFGSASCDCREFHLADALFGANCDQSALSTCSVLLDGHDGSPACCSTPDQADWDRRGRSRAPHDRCCHGCVRIPRGAAGGPRRATDIPPRAAGRAGCDSVGRLGPAARLDESVTVERHALMCGIVATIGVRPAIVAANARTALRQIAHRGPDDEGTWTNGPAWLGTRRLSIIDVTPAGHQPMIYEASGIAITYNGEIYNYLELRAELEAAGHQFITHCDTEVLLAAYLIGANLASPTSTGCGPSLFGTRLGNEHSLRETGLG